MREAPDYAWALVQADALSAGLDPSQLRPENPLWRQEVTERLYWLCRALGERGAAQHVMARHHEIDWGRALHQTGATR